MVLLLLNTMLTSTNSVCSLKILNIQTVLNRVNAQKNIQLFVTCLDDKLKRLDLRYKFPAVRMTNI